MRKYKITINDKYEANGSRFLNFDLADILELIQERGVNLTWQLCHLDFIDNKGCDGSLLESISKANSGSETFIKWNDVEKLGKCFNQIIDAKLIGKNKDEVIIISAFDSSFWEVITDNQTIIEKLKVRFKNIEIDDID